MMSIVSNTRVNIVARGVIKACLELGRDPGKTIAIFRIPGAWEEEGFKILDRLRDRVLQTAPCPCWRPPRRAGRRRSRIQPTPESWGPAMSILIEAGHDLDLQGIPGARPST